MGLSHSLLNVVSSEMIHWPVLNSPNRLLELFDIEGQITSDVDKQNTLRELYGSVDNIDAFVGFLAEDPILGGS
ncbi:MAG: hypothetical protein AAGI44_19265, partial [Pseudomonadota bacterium]